MMVEYTHLERRGYMDGGTGPTRDARGTESWMRAKYNHVYFTMKIISLCASQKVNLERQGRKEVGLELLIHLSLPPEC